MAQLRNFRCKRDRYDGRDLHFSAAVALPDHVDQRQASDRILDQGQLGSCVLNARSAMIEGKQPGFWDSRLAGYYWTRVLEHSTRTDAGCEPRDALKSLTKTGAAPEKDWPYLISKFRQRPPAKAYADAKKDVAWKYERLAGLDAVLAAFAAGHDVLFGLRLYPEFESDAVARTGKVPMPSSGEAEIGGHAMRGRGYTSRNGSRLIIVQNSWGAGWGDHGFCYLPFDYVADPRLCSDAWILTLAS